MKNLSYRLATAIGALCLSALAPAAMAQDSSAYSSLGFSWELIDLNPDDGIAPSLTFTESVESYSFGQSSPGAGSTDRRSDFGKTSRSSTLFDVETFTVPGQGLTAYARAAGNSPGWTHTVAENDYTFNFTLSASTGVRFLSFAHVEANSYGENTTYATASMDGQLFFPTSGTWERKAVFSDSLYVDNQIRDARLVGYLESDGWVRNGTVRLHTYAQADVGVSPVPEPQTYLMMLAGLALVGGVGRRLRK